MTRVVRISRAILYSAALVAAIYALDRLVLGPSTVPGWIEASDPDAIPKIAGPALIPPYLPSGLEWPPSMVLYRTDPPGWWLGIRGADHSTARLWIGTGDDQIPPALGPAAGCLRSDHLRPGCPPGWHDLSLRLGNGQIIHVLGDQDAAELTGILEGLERVGR